MCVIVAQYTHILSGFFETGMGQNESFQNTVKCLLALLTIWKAIVFPFSCFDKSVVHSAAKRQTEQKRKIKLFH